MTFMLGRYYQMHYGYPSTVVDLWILTGLETIPVVALDMVIIFAVYMLWWLGELYGHVMLRTIMRKLGIKYNPKPFPVAGPLDTVLHGYTPNGPPLKARKPGIATRTSGQLTLSRLGTEDFVIKIHDDITEATYASVLQACQAARMSTSRRTVVDLSTHGGDCHAACNIRDALAELGKDKEVIVWVTGACYSGGITVLCSVPIAQRAASSNAIFMVHAAAYPDGEIDSASRLIDGKMVEDIANATHATPESLATLMQSRMSYFFAAEEALKLGFIGSIV